MRIVVSDFVRRNARVMHARVAAEAALARYILARYPSGVSVRVMLRDSLHRWNAYLAADARYKAAVADHAAKDGVGSARWAEERGKGAVIRYLRAAKIGNGSEGLYKSVLDDLGAAGLSQAAQGLYAG